MNSDEAPTRKKTARSVELKPWEEAARDILVQEMRSRGVTYKGLSRLLEDFGIDEMPGRINRKVCRAQFSAGFLLACLGALGVEKALIPNAKNGAGQVSPASKK